MPRFPAMRMSGDLSVGADALPWGEGVAGAVREEAARLRELETAAKDHVPLPDGYEWRGELLVSVLDRCWVVRSTLLPRAVEPPVID